MAGAPLVKLEPAHRPFCHKKELHAALISRFLMYDAVGCVAIRPDQQQQVFIRRCGVHLVDKALR